MDQRTVTQLTILRHLQTLFSEARIRWWLRGGWAIDFILGRVTRRHADIDIVVWARQRSRVRRFLEEAGFTMVREWPTQADFEAQGECVSVLYLTRAANGRIITDGIPVWEWPAASLGSRPRGLEGILARVVGPRQLLWEKESTERGTGRPLRPKDLVSMETLREIIGVNLMRG
jgi:hypothetical protein